MVRVLDAVGSRITDVPPSRKRAKGPASCEALAILSLTACECPLTAAAGCCVLKRVDRSPNRMHKNLRLLAHDRDVNFDRAEQVPSAANPRAIAGAGD